MVVMTMRDYDVVYQFYRTRQPRYNPFQFVSRVNNQHPAGRGICKQVTILTPAARNDAFN